MEGMSLRIRIQGPSGEGKTTVALAVQQLLAKAGFDVVVRDEDLDDKEQVHTDEYQAQRLAAMGERRQKVEIETMQIRGSFGAEPDRTERV